MCTAAICDYPSKADYMLVLIIHIENLFLPGSLSYGLKDETLDLPGKISALIGYEKIKN